MIFKEKLKELKACSEAVRWAGDRTVEEVVADCHRGDWLLWLASRLDIGLQPLTLAKGHCANTVRHLMKDERSIKAVDTAIAFGEGNCTLEDLKAAAASAAYYSAAAAAAASDAAAAAVCYSAYAASSASAAASAAYYSAAAAKKQNQRQTADICRKYIGDLIINKVNNDI